MKPNKTVIKLSKELWKLGARKELHRGGWVIKYNEKNPAIILDPYPIPQGTIVSLDNAEIIIFPDAVISIWTSPDECIEWLREEGYTWERDIYIGPKCSHFRVILSTLKLGLQIKQHDVVAPTLTEALLKAMIQVKSQEGK